MPKGRPYTAERKRAGVKRKSDGLFKQSLQEGAYRSAVTRSKARKLDKKADGMSKAKGVKRDTVFLPSGGRLEGFNSGLGQKRKRK